MPTFTDVNGIIWNYTLDGSNNASIGNNAFSDATTLGTGLSGLQIIPSTVNGYTVTSINPYSFFSCSGLTSVTIPDSVTSIQTTAFYGCTGLTSVTIGISVKSIGSNCFNNCTSLTSVAIPFSVTSIDDGAFDTCSGLTSVTIGDSVTIIGARAFTSCSVLTSVTIGTSVTSIGDYAFSSCSVLTSLTIPNSVTSIGQFAISYCGGLTSVTIGKKVTTIGYRCFRGSYSLTSINIPDSVTSIGDQAFRETSNNLTVTMNTGKFGITSPSTNQYFFWNGSVDFVLPPPPPTITITSTTPGVTSGSTTNNTSIALTFTSNESTSNFAGDDITLTNGSLFSSFAGIGTDGKVYTATFTPAGQGLCTIDVSANKFTNAAGEDNAAANTFTWTFDNVSPSMTITSTTPGVTSGSTTQNTFIELTFTSNEATNNFLVGGISVTNGALSNFAGIGTDGKVYTATFTPTGPGACTIGVDAGAYTDAATNLNNLATQFNWTFDSDYGIPTNSGGQPYTPTPLSFVGNKLTIVDTIDATDTDVVSFQLTAGNRLYPLSVSSFSGSGTVTYSLDISGGSNVNSGTFSSAGASLLPGDGSVTASVNTTYILTMTANAAISYTIIGYLDYGIKSVSWTSPTETILRASNFGQDDYYGVSVAISGNYAIVGANQEDGSSNATADSGAAYIFERDGSGNWAEKTILRASNLGLYDNFGYSVAISGNYAIVGAINESGEGNAREGCGAAYIFERNGSGNWIQNPNILRASNLGDGDWFGWSVAISGNYAIVGAHNEDGTSNFTSTSGAAYIFERNGSGNWIQTPTILRASNIGAGDSFGYSVAISGNYAIVGAYLEDGSSNTTANSGAAYIFERDGSGNWSEKTILQASNILAGYRFGGSVAISGNYAIIGADLEDGTDNGATTNDFGAAYIFERDGSGNWIQNPTILRASNFGAGDNFGYSVAISGNYAIVGAYNEDGSSNTTANSGAAYIFERSTAGVWSEKRILRASNIGANDQFGLSVAIDGNYVIVGTTFEDGTSISATTNNFGAAYIYSGSVLVDPKPLSFINNEITITNSIDATDTDKVSFELTARSSLYPFSVTSFTGTGTVSYSLDISGGANIKTGTFSANNFDLLTGTAVTASVNTTYILTLTANAAITYTIVGLLDSGIYVNNIWASPRETMLRASNSQNEDAFGYSVAISGNYAIVGAWEEDGSSTSETFNNGAAYIFEPDNSGMMIEKQILRASNLGENDRFGQSVAISGNYAIVGAHYERGSSDEYYYSGAAYVFERDSSGNWIEKTILRASNIGTGDYFGYAVAISGNYAIVGAYSEDDNDDSKRDSGAAYIFERISGNWIETKLLRASDIETYAEFGWSVAISGNYAIVGAPGGAYGFTGSAYIFERNGSGNWIQHPVILKASNFGYGQFGESDRFGETVAISGNYAIVGAWSEDGSSNATADSGAAYIFERDGSGNWTEKSLLRASNLETNDRFGQSVAISGNYAVVGAHQEDGTFSYGINDNYGAAYIFERDGSGNWNETKIIRASYSDGSMMFGASVAIDGNYVIAGAARYYGPNYQYGSGAAYIYAANVIEPTPLAFVGNTLTISNSIDATDIDAFSFSLTAGSSLYPFSVTSFSGTGTISYSLAISGGASLKIGTFSAANFDLLAGVALTASGNTTYVLTLTADSAMTYTIVGSIFVPPTNIKLSNNSVDELQPVGTTIGTLTCNNSNTSFITYSVSDTANFSITGSTLKTNAIFDYETTSSYTVTITASIAGLSSSSSRTILVTNISGEAAELRRQNLQGPALKTAADSQGIPITATDLRDVGYNLIELKSAVYNATQLKAAAYTATELKDVSFNATELKTALFTATELRDASFNLIQLKDASFNATELKDASFNAIQLKDVSFNATELKEALFTATELKEALFTATELKEALFTATELKTALFTATELKTALFTATELKTALFTATELKDASFTAIELKTALFTATELKDASFNATELKDASFNATELKEALFNATQLKEALFNATELKEALFNATELKDALFNATELKDASFNATELKEALFTATELKDASFNATQLKDALFTATELKTALFTVTELEAVGFTTADLDYGIFMDPTPLSFVNNTMIITDRIDANDTDAVSFEVTAGNKLYPFGVTSFSGTGIVTYTLDISGGANVITGTFSAANVDLLEGTPVTASGNTTYILTLTSNAAITYTIVAGILISPTNIILSNNSVNELQPIGTTIGTLSCDNPNNAFIAYSVSDTTHFSITGSTLKTNVIFDYETTSSYVVTITSSIGGLTSSSLKTITVINILGEAAELRRQNLQGPALKTAADSQGTPVTASELKAAGYDATELKAAVYTATELKEALFNATQLKTALFTATELKDASFNATELKEALFNATELKEALFTATELKTALFTATELKDASFNATELKDASFTATELKTALFTATELKTVGFTATELKTALFTATELKDASFNATELKEALFTATQLKDASFNATELKDASFNATELKEALFTAAQLKDALFTATELNDAAYTATDLRFGGFTLAQLITGGFTATELNEAAYTAAELKTVGFTLDQLITGGYSAANLKEAEYTVADLTAKGFSLALLKDGGYTAAEMKSSFSLDLLVSGGYNATELRDAAFTVAELTAKDFTLAQLKTGGYTAAEMKSSFSLDLLVSGGYNATELKAAAYTVADLASRGFLLEQLKTGGYSVPEMTSKFSFAQLKTGGYTALEMKSSFSLNALITGGYNATELKAAAYTAAELKSRFTLAQLKTGGYTALEMKDANFSVAQLKAGGYTVAEMTSSYTLAELKAGGYSAAELSSSYTLTQLIDAGYTAAELKAAGYSVADLKTRFTIAQLKTGGYSAAEMKAASFLLGELIDNGYSAVELKAAAYTVADLTSRFTFAELKAGGYSATEMKSSYTLAQLIDGGYTTTELKAAEYTVAELKSAGVSFAQLKASGYTPAEMTPSYTFAELKDGGYTAVEMKASSYTLDQLIGGGYTAAELKSADYTVTELAEKGFTFATLKTVGYTATEMDAVYSLDQLIGGGYTAAELKSASYSVADLTAKGFSFAALKEGGYTALQMDAVYTLDELISGGYNAVELRAAAYSVTDLAGKGFTLATLKSGGYTVAEMTPTFSLADLKTGGYTAAQMTPTFSLTLLKDGGYTAAELRNANFTAAQMNDAGFTLDQLKTGGYTAAQMTPTFSLTLLKDGGYTAAEFRDSNFTATQLNDAGFTLDQLKTGGYTAAQMTPTFSLALLKDGGYTAAEFRDSNFTATQLNDAGFTLDQLKTGGYTAAQMTPTFSLALLKDGGYTAAEFRDSNFTAAQLKIANFTIDELKTGGYSAAQMKVAEYNATELKTAGYTVTQMKEALYSATELNNAGYTSLQLVDGGFNAASLITVGIVPDWNVFENANCITTSYIQDFVDVSGSIILRENANLYVNGNVEIGGDLLLNRLVVAGDANLNRSIFVGGDMSMNGKVVIRGDISMNGTVTNCSFNNNSISKSAFAGAVPEGPNYTTTKIVYDQKFQSNDDVSMNGATFASNNVKVSGNIVFGDGTVMNTYDNNILTASPKVFKASTFTGLDICGNLVAGSYATSSDYRIKTNIVELDETYNVDKLRPVKYYQTHINREKYGLIAHELQEHYPDLVVGEKDGSELQRINYMGVIAILINDIKRLKLELTEIETNVVIG